jgi:fermentation-respiration switch protein FrsA (DUF1100 family)
LFQYNPDHTDIALLKRAAATAVAPVSVRELLQFADWIVRRQWVSEDGSVDYRAAISAIRTPTLVIAGAADRLVPPYLAKPAFDMLAAADKAFMEAGRRGGMHDDYGHIDMMFGERAPDEIFPIVAGWLRSHQVGACTP